MTVTTPAIDKLQQNTLIEETRSAKESEFFFREHTNIGKSEEFERLIKFINRNSNLKIEHLYIESLEQIKNNGPSNVMGVAYNFKVVKKDKNHENE
jgi:hypothetical protein|tara:strand:- start:421 stop:708 length:288 start_codon:yes stop_codon:yes gene_type:complete